MTVLLRIGDLLTVLKLGLYFALSMQLTVGTLIAVLVTAFGRRG